MITVPAYLIIRAHELRELTDEEYAGIAGGKTTVSKIKYYLGIMSKHKIVQTVISMSPRPQAIAFFMQMGFRVDQEEPVIFFDYPGEYSGAITLVNIKATNKSTESTTILFSDDGYATEEDDWFGSYEAFGWDQIDRFVEKALSNPRLKKITDDFIVNHENYGGWSDEGRRVYFKSIGIGDTTILDALVKYLPKKSKPHNRDEALTKLVHALSLQGKI